MHGNHNQPIADRLTLSAVVALLLSLPVASAAAQSPCVIRAAPGAARALLEEKTERPTSIAPTEFYRALGQAARMLDPQEGYVLLGTEAATRKARFRRIAPIYANQRLTLGRIFSIVLQQTPGERCIILGRRLVNFYPAGAPKDRSDVLNTRLAGFRRRDLNVSAFLSAPWFYLNGVFGASGPMSVMGGTVTIPSFVSGPTTVRGLMNKVMVQGAERQMRASQRTIISGWVWLRFLDAGPGRPKVQTEIVDLSPYWRRPPAPPAPAAKPVADCGESCGEIAGRVVDEAGRPAAAAEVIAVPLVGQDGQMLPAARTNVEGNFRFPRLRFGKYRISAGDPAAGYPPAVDADVYGTSQVRLAEISRAQPNSEVVVRLGPKAAALDLIVIDEATRKRLPSAGPNCPTMSWRAGRRAMGGSLVGPRPSTLFIPSGRAVSVTITARGYSQWTRTFRLQAGATRAVTVKLRQLYTPR